MDQDRILLYRAIPGPFSLVPIVERFCREGEGSVTCLNDSMLPVLRAACGDDSDVEVVPFAALVRRALEAAGEQARPIASTTQQVAAVAQAAKSVPADSTFRNAARFPGLCKALVRTLGELSEWGIGAEELEALSAHVGEPLSRKLLDLASISKTTDTLIQSIGRDRHSRQIEACLEGLPDPDGRSPRILAFLGADASPLKIKWLKWASAHGAKVTAVVDRHASGHPLFRQVESIEKEIGGRSIAFGSGNRLLANLFVSGAIPLPGPDIEIKIVSTGDPLAECEAALRACLANGAHLSSAIFVRNLEFYAPLLQATATRLGASIQMPRRVGLLTNAFARMSLAVLEACAGVDVRLLRPVLQSSYLSLSAEQRKALLAALAESHSKRGHQWELFGEWLASRGDEFAWLKRVLDWRTAVSNTACDLRDWTQRLKELVHELPWHQALGSTQGYDPQRDVRAFSVMQTSLSTEAALELTTGAPSLFLRAFAERCRAVWTAAEVSVPAEEGFRVASDAAGLGSAAHVVVLGMLEGVFPRRRTEDAILSDLERREISSLRPEHLPLKVSSDVALEERDEFYRVCAAAKEKLTFSFPLTDDQRDNIPAFYLEFVKQAVGIDRVCQVNVPRTEWAPLTEECVSPADLAMRIALDGAREEPALFEPTSGLSFAVLRRDPPLYAHPRELRDALSCPFQHQMRHRFGLRSSRPFAKWLLLPRLPADSGLAAAPDAASAERALKMALEVELDLLVVDTPAWEMQVLNNGGRRLIAEWVGREFKGRTLWPKKEGSTVLDVPFGSETLRDTMPYGVKLKGKAPAVSSMNAGTTVLRLYGSFPSDPAKLSEAEQLYYGLFLLSAYKPGAEVALEIDGLESRRTLVLLTRSGNFGLSASHEDKLFVVDLSRTDDPTQAKKLFFDEVKKHLAVAARSIEQGRIEPTSGDHCSRCDLGELCRRHPEFSDDDSPFSADWREHDGD